MPRSRLILASSCLAALFSFARCAAPGSGGGGTGGSSSNGGSTGTGGSSSSTGGSTGSTGGSSPTGGSTGTGGTTTTGTGGTTGKGGSSGTGGSTSTGGSSATGGSTGTGGTSSSSTGGSTGTGGTTGNPGTGGTIVDQGGMPLGNAGATTSASKAYFNLGDMRLINNRWGSDALNCTGTMQSVFINSDKTIGWSFNRPTCGGMRADPDFPEVEFGVAPFGSGSSLLTTPSYSSTTLLPIQISSLTSASVTFDNFSTTFQKPGYWDSNFEFWISKEDPTKNADAGVYAEIIIFLGWEANRQNGATGAGGWACSVPGSSGPVSGTNFTLCHQSDKWSQSPYWRFFNFVLGNGADSNSVNTYTGKVDIKAILSWVMSNYPNPGSGAGGNGNAPFSSSMYLTRIEVGTEIDDNTQGSAKINNLAFEINGTTKSIQIGN